jgi:hypothetical protein
MYRVKPPSKALGARQAFDIEGLSNFADDKAARHHKAFSGEVEIGSFSPPGYPRHIRTDGRDGNRDLRIVQSW